MNSSGISRYPQDIEAAVYFCCLEALQNVQKYAQALGGRVDLHSEPGAGIKLNGSVPVEQAVPA